MNPRQVVIEPVIVAEKARATRGLPTRPREGPPPRTGVHGARRGAGIDGCRTYVGRVSEKSYALMADGKYTFRVHERAHKTQIAHAVEQIFDVGVTGVRTSRVRAKPKRRGLNSRQDALLEEGDRPARSR